MTRSSLLTAEYMLGKLLDHYSTLNVEDKISEEEMEARMDRARLMSKEQLRRAYQRLRRKGQRHE